MPLNIQKPVITFYEKDSDKAKATKLNEFVMMIEKRLSEIESENEKIKERITDIELTSQIEGE
jgi:ribosomal protein S10